MGIAGEIYRFSPAGLSDAVGEDFGFPGCCVALTNLIPDPSNKNLWQARPAATLLANLPAAFASNAVISVMVVVGNRVYGMAQGSGSYVGYDIPFCYDLVLGAFQTITGYTTANVPASQPTSYSAWTPPDMALVGTYLVICHPGYDGVTHFYGWINLANPASLAYSSGNAALNPLSTKPSSVQQFNGRAFFILNPLTGQPVVAATDALNPLQITNAAYALSFGDNTTLTGFGTISLQSPLTGGVVQALLVFKDGSNIYQITGDFSTTVAQNSLNATTGTAAINTIVNTPFGILFMAADGIRVINQQGLVGPPLGVPGQGVVAPFINVGVPSRAVAAATASVLRVSLQNTGAAGAPVQEYWYDLVQERWSGPHTFPAQMIAPWQNTFIMQPYGVGGGLWRSDVQQSNASSFIENGNQLTWTMQSSLFADPQQLSRISLDEGFVRLSAYAGMPAPTAALLDQNGSTLNTCLLQPGNTAYYWGVYNWGTHIWLGTPNGLIQNPFAWNAPVVVDEVALQLTGQSGLGFKLGDVLARAELLGFMPGTP